MADLMLAAVMEDRLAQNTHNLLQLKSSTLNLNLLRPKVMSFNIGVLAYDRYERKLSNLSYGIDEVEDGSKRRKATRQFHRNAQAEILLQKEVRHTLERSNCLKAGFQALYDSIGKLKARLQAEEKARNLHRNKVNIPEPQNLRRHSRVGKQPRVQKRVFVRSVSS